MPTAKKMPSGSWKCRVYTHTEGGIAHTKSFTAKTKREAERLAAEYEYKVHVENCDTIKNCFEKYIDIKKISLSPSTEKTYRQMINKSYKSIENVRISCCGKELLQKWIDGRAKSVSPKTVKNEYALLVSCYEHFGFDMPRLTLPKRKAPEYILPSDADLEKMLEYCRQNCKYMAIVIMLSSCGTLRRGEICGLRYEDINGTTLFVHRNIVTGVDGIVEKDTKTKQSTRFVDVPQFVIDEIGSGTGRIIPYNPNAVSKRFYQIRDKLGLPKFRLHDLRHYSASRMAALGIPKQYIAERGGWKAGSSVLDTVYINTISEERRRFEDKTNEYFEKFNGNPCPETCPES